MRHHPSTERRSAMVAARPPTEARTGAMAAGRALRHLPPMSLSAASAVDRALELAEDRGDTQAGPAHLLLSLLARPACAATDILERFEVGAATLAAHLCKLLPPPPRAASHPNRSPQLGEAAIRALIIAGREARGSAALSSAHLLLGLLQERVEGIVGMILRDHGLTEEGIRAAIRRARRAKRDTRQ